MKEVLSSGSMIVIGLSILGMIFTNSLGNITGAIFFGSLAIFASLALLYAVCTKDEVK